MPNVYVMNESGTTKLMERIHCKDEARELQEILMNNTDLLPGDQIDPEDPSRWMLIKREMPVPDPNTGSDRWRIDFLLVDQNAMPTFVECKRFEDTRSRREVVGQVLEYAANGQYYWTEETLRDYAEASAKQGGTTIEEAFGILRTDTESMEAFFKKVLDNLKEGQLRIVFFLEEAPSELKSLVEFLNKQMVSSEVLLVEARQYKYDGVTVVVPTLFGYTDQARQIKRTVTVGPRTGSRPKTVEELVAAISNKEHKRMFLMLLELWRDAGNPLKNTQSGVVFQAQIGQDIRPIFWAYPDNLQNALAEISRHGSPEGSLLNYRKQLASLPGFNPKVLSDSNPVTKYANISEDTIKKFVALSLDLVNHWRSA